MEKRGKRVVKTFFVKMISDFKLLKIFSVHFTPIFESSESLFFVKCKLTCKDVENRVIKIFPVKKFSYLKLLKNCAERFTTISESSESSFCVQCKFLYGGG